MKLNSSGVTPVEIVLILAIAMVMLVLAFAPSVMLTDKMRFETYKAEVVDLLHSGQNIAKAKGECVVVTVSGQTVSVKGYKTAKNCLEYSSGALDQTSLLVMTLGQETDVPNLSPFWTGQEKNLAVESDSLIFNTNGFVDKGPAFLRMSYKQFQTTFVISQNSNTISEK